MKKSILALCLMTALASQANCYSEGVRVGTQAVACK